MIPAFFNLYKILTNLKIPNEPALGNIKFFNMRTTVKKEFQQTLSEQPKLALEVGLVLKHKLLSK